MTFAHPWAMWVAGAAALAVPIIHLLTRPRPVRFPLATVRLVDELIRQRKRRNRLRDLVILLLRVSAVLLIGAAIARPRFDENPDINDQGEATMTRVVLLDVSQSMARSDGAIEAFSVARSNIQNHLQPRKGMRANLILAATQPHSVFDQPTSNLTALRDALAQARVRPETINVRAALDAAGRMLAPADENDTRKRQLIVVSDFQRSNWTKADFSILPAGVDIRLESVVTAKKHADRTNNNATGNVAAGVIESNDRSKINLSIREVSVAMAPGAAFGELLVQIVNDSPAARPVQVETKLGDDSWTLSKVCPAEGETTLSRRIPITGDGWRTGVARIVDTQDALAADNLRPMAVRIRTRPRFTLLTRQEDDGRVQSSSFVACALAPEQSGNETSGAEVVIVAPDELRRATLASSSMIIIDHPGMLDEPTVDLLAEYMRRGRSILYFASDSTCAINLHRLVQASGDAARPPVEWIPPAAATPRSDLRLARVDGVDSPFKIFGEQLPVLVDKLRFAGGLQSRTLEGAVEDEILATYEDGSAAIVSTRLGGGMLSVVNADMELSDLPRTKVFVPLLDELIARMLDDDARGDSLHCGQAAVVRLPPESGLADELRVYFTPGVRTSDDIGSEMPENNESAAGGDSGVQGASLAGQGTLLNEGLGVVWRHDAPPEPGVYRFRRRDAAPTDADLLAVPVTIPAEESRLECLPPEVLTERLTGGRTVYFREVTQSQDSRDRAWSWLAVACVVCMLSEITALLWNRN